MNNWFVRIECGKFSDEIVFLDYVKNMFGDPSRFSVKKHSRPGNLFASMSAAFDPAALQKQYKQVILNNSFCLK